MPAHLLKQIVDHAPLVAFIKGLDGRYLMANETYHRLFGTRAEEVLGRTDHELFPPEFAVAFTANDREVARLGASITVEEVAPVHGELRTYLSTKFPLLDEEGEIVAVGGYAVDITDRRRALQELEEMRARYVGALRHAAEIIVVFDMANGGLIEANEPAERFFGMTRAELIGQAPWSVSPPCQPDGRSSHAAAGVHLVRAMQEGQCSFDWVHLSASGELLPCRIRLVGLPDGGQVVQAYIQDLRVRDEEQRARERDRRFLDSIQRLSHVGAWEVDLEGEQLHWSRETYRIHGLDPDGYTPDLATAIERYTPESVPRIRQAVEGALRDGIPYDMELAIRRQDGREVQVRAVGVVDREGGRPTRLHGTLQDISERRTLEEQLRQSQKLEGIGQLAGGIAHDFNNLLTVISVSAELLRDSVRSPEEAEDLGAILRAAEHAEALTSHLLAFARRSSGHPQVVVLDAELQRSAHMLRRLLGEDVQLALDLDATDGAVRVDRTHFEQVLVNLAVNARDAMPSGGSLSLSTERTRRLPREMAHGPAGLPPGPYLTLVVRDDGEGMPSEVVEHVFEPFFTTKAQGEGTGLGLSTVHGIVHQWGGALLVDSAPGQGTTFTVWIPEEVQVALPPPSSRSPRQATAAPGGLLLLVEDDDAVRRLTSRVLREAGWQIQEAAHGAEALALLDGLGPLAGLVTDVVMPDMSGLELADHIRAIRPDVPVLFVSGYAAGALAARGIDVATIDLLAKPFRPAELLERVSVFQTAP